MAQGTRSTDAPTHMARSVVQHFSTFALGIKCACRQVVWLPRPPRHDERMLSLRVEWDDVTCSDCLQARGAL